MDKINVYSKWALRACIAGTLIFTLASGHWVGTSGGAAVLISTFIFEYLNNKILKINKYLVASVYLYCIFSLVMGTMWEFYDKIQWWDILMHILSGIILGAAGIEILNSTSNLKLPVKPSFLFVLGIACLGGIVWEIYEFSIDLLFGLDTQLSSTTGVSDTMWDIIADLAGGILAGVYFLLYKK